MLSHLTTSFRTMKFLSQKVAALDFVFVILSLVLGYILSWGTIHSIDTYANDQAGLTRSLNFFEISVKRGTHSVAVRSVA